MPDHPLIDELSELLAARGPAGQEDEVRNLCKTKLDDLCDDTWTDPAGNLIGLKKGENEDAPGIRVLAHMDELAMVVKRVEPDGRLAVLNVGGLHPSRFGQGPVDILGDHEICPGVLSFGSAHVSSETRALWDGKAKDIPWKHVHVFTGLDKDALTAAGIHAGTRVVIAQSRRSLFPVGDYLGAYFMDNRAAICCCLASLRAFHEQGSRPASDLYVVLTSHEEIGAVGASYAAQSLPGDLSIAVDVGPAEAEYGIELNSGPIIVYRDSHGLYDVPTSRRLLQLATELELAPQCAIWESYGSDASIPKKLGHAARSALICMPTLNTHGFEVIHRDSVSEVAKLLTAYLLKP